MTLQSTEAECAANATAPRVSLASMEAKISARYDFTGDQAIHKDAPVMESLKLLSICLLVMENGFTLIGKSAPASAANFNAELGRKLAYEDAIRQLWPLEGYALRDRLSGIKSTEATSKSILTGLREALLLAVFILPFMLLRAWALTVMWGWYIVPAFGVQPLRVVFAFGILTMVVGFIKAGSDRKKKSVWSSISLNLAHPLVTLGLGWIGTFFV